MQNNDLILKTNTYLEKFIQQKVDFSPLEDVQKNQLPIVLTIGYDFFTFTLMGQTLIACFKNTTDEITPKKLQKQMWLVKQKLGITPIFICEHIISYNLQRIVNLGINFIVPNQQIFIPDILLNLQRPKTSNSDLTAKIPTMAQMMILYHLEVEKLNGKNTKELSTIFKNASYATINRALRWLLNNEIIIADGNKDKVYSFVNDGKELWSRVLPLLSTPIAKKIYTDNTLSNTIESGINALSHYTMINGEQNLCYAFSKAELKTLNFETDKSYGENTIEIWNYDPKLLAKGGFVDRLSLYLTLKDTPDERVQIELIHLINDLQW